MASSGLRAPPVTDCAPALDLTPLPATGGLASRPTEGAFPLCQKPILAIAARLSLDILLNMIPKRNYRTVKARLRCDRIGDARHSGRTWHQNEKHFYKAPYLPTYVHYSLLEAGEIDRKIESPPASQSTTQRIVAKANCSATCNSTRSPVLSRAARSIRKPLLDMSRIVAG